METLYERIVSECPRNSLLELYTLDAQGDSFTIYKGEQSGLSIGHLQKALRNEGIFYVMSLISTVGDVDEGVHHNSISRREFCWLTPPLPPVLAASKARSLSFSWEPLRYCGIGDEAVERIADTDTVEYIFEVRGDAFFSLPCCS